MLEREAHFSIIENDNLNNYFDEYMYFFKYDGIIRKTIIDYKFNDKSYLYKTFTNFLLKNEKFCANLKSYDIIIPVPISLKRKKQRGYNQSYLIARQIAKYMGIKLENRCLIKNKNIIEQSKLNKEERKQNIIGVYELKNEEKIKGKNVLIIDDIFTTGSTVNECSKTLTKAGTKKIGVLTIAKD